MSINGWILIYWFLVNFIDIFWRKKRIMLFPATFISASEKQAANFFLFNFTRRRVVRYSCFDFFSSEKWRYFLLPGLWNTYLAYQIRRAATYVYVEIHKVLNFPRICSGDWNICAEYDLRGWLSLTGALTLTGTRKPTVMQVSDYKAWLSLMGTLAIIRMPRI